MICSRCDVDKPDVEPLPDPYLEEIAEVIEVDLWCADCYGERKAEV